MDSKLTPVERKIAGLVARGWTNAHIANKLFLSQQTVKNHLVSIFKKSKVENRVKLTVQLLRQSKSHRSSKQRS